MSARVLANKFEIERKKSRPVAAKWTIRRFLRVFSFCAEKSSDHYRRCVDAVRLKLFFLCIVRPYYITIYDLIAVFNFCVFLPWLN